MNQLQLHGAYLIAVGTLMMRQNRSANLVTQGNNDGELVKIMASQGVAEGDAWGHVTSIDPHEAINAQF